MQWECPSQEIGWQLNKQPCSLCSSSHFLTADFSAKKEKGEARKRRYFCPAQRGITSNIPSAPQDFSLWALAPHVARFVLFYLKKTQSFSADLFLMALLSVAVTVRVPRGHPSWATLCSQSQQLDAKWFVPCWYHTVSPSSSIFRQKYSVRFWILYLLLLVYYSLPRSGSKVDTCMVPELKPNYSFSCCRFSTSLVNYVSRTRNTSTADTKRATNDAESSPTNGSLPEMSHMSEHLINYRGMYHIFASYRPLSQWWLFSIIWRVSAYITRSLHGISCLFLIIFLLCYISQSDSGRVLHWWFASDFHFFLSESAFRKLLQRLPFSIKRHMLIHLNRSMLLLLCCLY
jgi:hypothetical protein